MVEPSTNLGRYDGPTLIEALDHLKLPVSMREIHKPLRIPIHGFYKVGGIGNVPVGRIVTGYLTPGMVMNFAPTGLQRKVKSVKIDGEVPLSVAFPGDFVGLDVEDVAAKDLQPGYVASNSKNDPAMGAADFTSYVIITKDPGMIQTGYTP